MSFKCPFNSKDWDDVEPDELCRRRFQKDVMDLVVNPPDNIYSIPSEKNIFCVQSMIIGSVDTPYEGGFFHFYIRAGPSYPSVPPRVCSMSSYRFGLSARFNPNLYSNGTVCLSILGTWPGPCWVASLRLSSLLQSIQATIMVNRAICNEPGYEGLKESQLIKYYDMYVRHETIRIAVLHTLKTSKENKIPSKLVEVMEKKFLEYYSSYIKSCNEFSKECDGQKISMPLVNNFTPNFAALKEKLSELHEKISKKMNLQDS